MATNYGYALDPGFKGILASVGVRHQDVLRRAALPEDILNRAEARVDSSTFFRFIQAIQDSVDDETLPVRMVEQMSAAWFSPPVFAALCSPDLVVATQRLARFKPLIAPIHLQVDRRPSTLQVTFHWLGSDDKPALFLYGSEALFLVKLARMGTHHAVQPVFVGLPELPVDPGPYEAFFGCPLERHDVTTVHFHADDASRPFLTDNSTMWDIFEPELRRRLADLDGAASFEERTRAVLLEALPSGQVSVEAVARRLAVSSRTLQRRLREEHTTFNHVVRSTRERLSRHYLGHTQLSIHEIAYLLGFEEPTSFYRAFQRWTGTTPEALRRTLNDME